jgi:HTH-type transcriptional regulator, cell division transcriptional repressor
MDKVLFGERLKRAREAAGISRKLMSSRIGVTEGTIEKWESGGQIPRANRLQMLASLLNVPLMWLLAGSQNVPEPGGDLGAEQVLQQKFSEVNVRMEELKNSIEDLGALVQNGV